MPTVIRTKLLNIARDAAKKQPRNASVRYGLVISEVINSAPLLWELFREHAPEAVSALWAEIGLIEVKKPSASQSELEHRADQEFRKRVAEKDLDRAITNATIITRQYDDEKPEVAFAEKVKVVANEAGQRIADAIQSGAISRLNAVLVDGKPLGQCTAAEAMAWADRQDGVIDFVRTLCRDVPPDRVLADWYSGQDARIEAIWAHVHSPEHADYRQKLRLKMESAWQDVAEKAKPLGESGRKTVLRSLGDLGRARRWNGVDDAARATMALVPDMHDAVTA
jgi:hypothetical protein